MTGAPPLIVEIDRDEFRARPQILAWLGYPHSERFRTRAENAIIAWARHQARLSPHVRTDRVEGWLTRLDIEIDRQFVAAEIFRRQILTREFDDGFWGSASTKAFATRLESEFSLDYRNARRDFWDKRQRAFALAIAVCAGHGQRPLLRDLVFRPDPWTGRAIDEAERMRLFAIDTGHPLAPRLLQFEHVSF